MIDNKNMILAVVLSIAILVGFDTFFSKKQPAPVPGEQAASGKTLGSGQTSPQVPQTGGTAKNTGKSMGAQVPSIGNAPSKSGAAVPPAPGSPGTSSALKATDWTATRQAALKKGQRIQINAPRLHGSISLTGGGIDDLTLANYRETLDPGSSEIVLLNPKGTDNAYFADFGWVAGEGQPVPGADTPWKADKTVLSPDSPVTLTWDNGKGLTFFRTYAIDKNYMIAITQKVKNTGAKAATLYPYGLISRHGKPEVTGFYILHEGLMGVASSTLTEITYDDIQEKGEVKETTTGGWVGITDKYWLSALIPDQKVQVSTRFIHRKEVNKDVYQVDYLSQPFAVGPGQTVETQSHLFAGAKEVTVLDAYNEDLKIDRFDLAIDFGWFYFLTKPIFYALLYINGIVLNFGVSIILLTMAIKLVFFPLANKSYTSMSAMKKLQPQIAKLRERCGDDKTKLNQEMMELYKREKVNPASGCLPILIQIPVFFALYKVLFINIEMRHAPFFGWIQDLSAPDPTSLFNLFGMIPWTPPDFLMIGVWPLIMGGSMFLQQKLNPQPTDPIQAKIFLFLPLMFTFLLARFPAGLVIYWAVNNILSMSQQWLIMRRMGITGKDALK
ncbi:MAG: membrane protein insertase YidC [Rhodospirillales bacterium]|nr:membrane protein insertase YidC [Rhodospirillales bacterium]